MIDFDNETENFEETVSSSINPTHFLTTKITYNGNSKRMNIPRILKQKFAEPDFIRMYWVTEPDSFYIDFKYNNGDMPPEGVDFKDLKIMQTGRGYFITLPGKWFKYAKPIKASLMQIEEKRTIYKVQFYGQD